MSSNSSRVTQGAAEEPEPEPDDAASTTGAASYDPTIYQRPHPDDAAAARRATRLAGLALAGDRRPRHAGTASPRRA